MNPTANVRVRIKGTSVYVAQATEAAYTTAGSGQRSLRWRPSAIGPNAALDYSAPILRNQSRDLVRKNALAASAVERISSNVVGYGIKPQGVSAAAAKLWLAWTDESSADGVLDFYGQQKQAMENVVSAGEVFIRRRVRRRTDGLSVPLQLEVLESEFVPHDFNQAPVPPSTDAVTGAPIPGRGTIRQGIEFDYNIRSKRVAYWMHRRHPGDNDQGASTEGNEPVRVPAREVLHLFLQNRPGQIRGEPWMARVLDKLLDLDQYDRAELTRKKTTALYAGFLKRPFPEGLAVDVNELQAIYGSDAEVSADGIGDVTMEPGTFQILQPGEEVEFSDPKDVGGMYEVFKRSHQRDIAAALGTLYEQLSGDYSQVNDRTWRSAMTEFRRRCEGWQHHLMVYQFCRPVWVWWGELAVLSGALSSRHDPYVAVKWTPPRWPYINPVQDIEALEMERKAGLASRSAQVSERGEEAAVIDAENAADLRRSEEQGLRYSSDPIEAVILNPMAIGTRDDEGESETAPQPQRGRTNGAAVN